MFATHRLRPFAGSRALGHGLCLLGAWLLLAAGCAPPPSPVAAPQSEGDATREAQPDSQPRTAKVLSAPSAGHLMLRGKDQLASGKAKPALGLFQQARAAGYELPDLHYYEGECYRALGDRAAMERSFGEFLRLTPKQDGELARKVREHLAAAATPPTP